MNCTCEKRDLWQQRSRPPHPSAQSTHAVFPASYQCSDHQRTTCRVIPIPYFFCPVTEINWAKNSTKSLHLYTYYHYSAKRGIAIACRLSVTLVDHNHIDWKSWKLIARKISPTPLLFIAQRPFTYSQGNIGKFLGRLEIEKGRGKMACWSNILETHKDRGKVTTVFNANISVPQIPLHVR